MNGSRPRNGFILEIENVTVAYQQGGRRLDAVRNVTLSIAPGMSCGLVGESGSGKTTLAMAALRALPENGAIRQGTIRFDGRDLTGLDRAAMRRIWGEQVALVPQNALAALNPSLRLGEQAAELLRQKEHMGPQQTARRVRELFEQVRLNDPDRVAAAYPHQVSGGMLQRVLTAMALSTRPLLLVLDEPTSSLDVTTQAAMLDLFRELMAGEQQTGMLYITHNLGVVAQISDRVAVMYASDMVEDAPTKALFDQPLHPYTRGLIDCVPYLGENKTQVSLRPIQGRIPDPGELPEGCVFRPRCPLAIDICWEYPPLYDAGPGRRSRCHRWHEIAQGEADPRQPQAQTGQPQALVEREKQVLEMRDVHVHFKQQRSLWNMLRGRRPAPVKAVDGVTLSVPQGRIVGLVGESGSGKTTLARAIVGLVERTGGKIRLFEMSVPPRLSKRGPDVLCCLQIIFQDPGEALNPFMSVGEALRRPLARLRRVPDDGLDEAVRQLLDAVHLSGDYAARLPGQLSGGEKQRVAIARAFAPNPNLVIADEPVSSLDVSVQASILALFAELQTERQVSILFISHNLAVVGYLADEIAVIYLGQLMEVGPTQAVFDPPYHPYTEALLSAVPRIDPQAGPEPIELPGELPRATEELSGCPFHTRCPRFLGRICIDRVPPWRQETATGKRIFCHIPLDELVQAQHKME